MQLVYIGSIMISNCRVATGSFSNEKWHLRVLLAHFSILLHFFQSNKLRIEILRSSVQLSAHELRSGTISWIFGWCPYQNKPRLSWSLKQKY